MPKQGERADQGSSRVGLGRPGLTDLLVPLEEGSQQWCKTEHGVGREAFLMLRQPEIPKKIPGIQATFTTAMKNSWRLSVKSNS